jgi:hypothetical protein
MSGPTEAVTHSNAELVQREAIRRPREPLARADP